MQDEPRWRRYLRLWGADPRADVEDELSFHIAERASLNEARGLSPEAARAEAERRFGDITRIREECSTELEREARRMRVSDRMGDFVRDVRIAIRSLSRAPMYALTAGIALALGIGANTAVFSVVSAVLLRPLPYAEPERVVAVHSTWDGTPEGGLSPAEYLDYVEGARAFDALGAYALQFMNLVEGDVAERIPAAFVTPSAFRALGVMPVEGRLFDESEGLPGAERVVVLSHEFWQSRFNGARDVIGRGVLINGTTMTIVGVLPGGVRLPDSYGIANPPALFASLSIDPAAVTARGSHFLGAIARLAPGWTTEGASAELSRVAREFVAAYPDDYPAEMRFDTFVRPVHADVVGDTRRLLFLLTGAVAMVLLIACANVSSLVLTRTEDRRRELAVRSALGAGRWRIARQLMAEHLVLALAAGAAGLFIAHVGVQSLVLIRPDGIPRLDEVRMDAGVLAFTAGLSLLATLLVALAPLRLGIGQGALREAGSRTTATRATQRIRHALIAIEVGLCIVLLAGAGLLLRSFANVLAVDPGYRTEQRLAVPISLPTSSYQDDGARRRYFAQLVADAAQMPGVLAAGAVSNLPLATTVGDLNIRIEGRTVAEGDVSPRLDWQVVTPGWFDAMDIPLVHGRVIAPSDDERAPGAVVLSESAARKYWPDGDAIGKRFRLGGEAGPGWVSVIGIVRDVRHAALTDEPAAIMYLPHAQFTFWNGGAALSAMTLVAHTAGDPLSLLQPLREHVRGMDPHVPLGAARTMTQVLTTAVAAPRFTSSVIAAFAVLALMLSLIGVYGLVGYTVARRTREIAVRMALGAEPRGLVGQIVLQGMAPVLTGVAAGGIAALAFSGMLRQLLYGVAPHDPLILLLTLGLLSATAAIACLLPARRATRIAPLSALRED